LHEEGGTEFFFSSTPNPVLTQLKQLTPLTPLTPPDQVRLEPPHDVAEPFDETSL